MGTDLKKVGTSNKVGIAAFATGAVLSLIFLPLVPGLIVGGGCIAGGVYCFKNLLKDYARTGKRF